jgi:hypothetical protein
VKSGELRLIKPFRHAEIRHVRFAGFVQDDVRGLEVPVQNPFLMRAMDRLRDGFHDLGRTARGQRLRPHRVGQVFPCHVIHGEVVLVFPLAGFTEATPPESNVPGSVHVAPHGTWFPGSYPLTTLNK